MACGNALVSIITFCFLFFYICISFLSFLDVWSTTTLTHQQPRQRSPVLYAPNAAPSGNLAKPVVAVAAVLGSETAEVLVTQNVVTRGTRASGPAKHGRS